MKDVWLFFLEVEMYSNTFERKFRSIVGDVCELWWLVRAREEKNPERKFKTIEDAESEFHVFRDD